MNQLKTYTLAILKWSYILLLLGSIAWPIMLGSFSARAARYLGYTPSYLKPDPGELPPAFDYHYELVGISFSCIPLSILTFLIALIFNVLTKRRFLGIDSAYLVVSFLFILVSISSIFSSTFTWFID